MKPFVYGSDLTQGQMNFNYNLFRSRIVVENTFGRLKARWRQLRKNNNMKTENIPNVFIACCILHNITEVHGDHFNDSWLDNVNDLEQPPSAGTLTASSDGAQAIRKALVQNYS